MTSVRPPAPDDRPAADRAAADRAAADREAAKRAERAERFELLAQIQDLLEPVMVVLGVVFLGLLIVEFAGPSLSTGQATWLGRAQTAIYWIFVADFALRFVIAPDKGRFLKANWLSLVSLALPALRPLRALRGLRALRAARATRSLRLVRLLGGANRGVRVLRRIARGRQFALVAALSVTLALLGAVGVLFFERGAPAATIGGFGDALWWASTIVTTINSGAEPVTLEGRIIGVLLRLYAVSVFGLITASIASYFIGRNDLAGGAEGVAGQASGVGSQDAALRAEVAALRREIGDLRAALAAPGDADAGGAEPGPGGPPGAQGPGHGGAANRGMEAR